MSARGLVIVLTGEGKGKTTSALGMAMRALGHGTHVLMIQFIKGAVATGEMETVRRLAPEFELLRFGTGFINPEKGLTEQDIAAAREGLEFARKAIGSGKYALIILDEVCAAMKLGLLRTQDVAELVRNRPEALHVVLTGRDAPREISRLADTVTDMKCVRHHFDSRRGAARGIEW